MSVLLKYGLLILLLLGSCTLSPATIQEPPASLWASTALSPAPTRSPGSSTSDPLPTSTAATLPGSPTPTLLDIQRTPAATRTPFACRQERGRIETGSLPTDLLAEPLDFRVYLPACYDVELARRYPSLYLIHGQSFNDDQWDRLGADESADALIASGEAPPFLIVMPRDRRWDQPDQDLFGQAVAEVLIPWIDSHYRTRTEREQRAIGGLSRGAGWAVHLALSRWELFGALGAHSLPVFWLDTYSIKEWLNAIPLDQMPRIYMDNPNNDRPEIMRSSLWFEKLLTQRRIAHEWHLFTGYHEEKYWQAHVEQYLRWFAEGW